MRGIGALTIIGGKVRLFSTTEGARPIVWDFFKGCAGSDAAIRISYFGIVDVPAKFTDVLLHNSFYFYYFLSVVIFWEQR